VLLRHGRTAWNAEGRLQGQSDVALDEVGLAQARTAAPVVAGLGPSRVWSSDLARAATTAARVGESTGLEVAHDVRLRELSFGDTEGLSREDLRRVSPDGHAALVRADYDQVPGAEPTPQVRARMTEVLHDLLDATGPGETSVAVSHGAALRIALGGLLGWPDDVFRSLGPLANCGWAVLETRGTGAPLRLTAYNLVATAPVDALPDPGLALPAPVG